MASISAALKKNVAASMALNERNIESHRNVIINISGVWRKLVA
jgi:hypothetical protein